jgi:ATP-dependent DNA ligase
MPGVCLNRNHCHPHYCRRVHLPVMPPVQPMLAKSVKGVPKTGELSFEPKWDEF